MKPIRSLRLNAISRSLRGLLVAATLLFAGWPAGAQPISVKDELTGADFVKIPGACFPLGVDRIGEMTFDEILLPPRRDETPRHEVCVDAFLLARTETTVAMWNRWMPTAKRSAPVGHPVSAVTLDDVERFISRLNERAGGLVYRLPTEAEWEHACRAGQLQPPEGDPSFQVRSELRTIAHFIDEVRRNSGPVPVASLKPNAFGLYDMQGNVWEWTADDYSPTAYARHAKKNPRHAEATGRRVVRGGSWRTGEFELRCGARGWGIPGDPLDVVGFRLVRTTGVK